QGPGGGRGALVRPGGRGGRRAAVRPIPAGPACPHRPVVPRPPGGSGRHAGGGAGPGVHGHPAVSPRAWVPVRGDGTLPGDASRHPAVVVMVLLLAAALVLAACGRPHVIEPEPPPPAVTPPDQGEEEPDPQEPRLPVAGPGETLHPLTGLPVKSELLERRPFLVSIDNHPRARPQYGLPQADLVYELPVEGGVTRFAALFWAGEADQIGPVRSSRPYFLDLALEWQAAFVPAGCGVFCRGDDRRPRHTLYTSSQRVHETIRVRGGTLKPALPDLWRFALPADLPQGEEAAGVAVRRPGGGSTAERFVYDEESGLYTRYVGDEPQVDGGSGEPLQVRNVIIQLAGTRVIRGDTEGRLEVDMVGSGQALV